MVVLLEVGMECLDNDDVLNCVVTTKNWCGNLTVFIYSHLRRSVCRAGVTCVCVIGRLKAYLISSFMDEHNFQRVQ